MTALIVRNRTYLPIFEVHMAAAGGVSHTQVLAGLVGGAVIGSLVNYLTMSGAAGVDAARPEWLTALVKYGTKPVGDIFINLLFMGIIPLVFSSLTVGVTRLGGTSNVGRVGFKTISYFLITTAFAASVGLVFVNLVKPGQQMPAAQREQMMSHFGSEAQDKMAKAEPLGINTLVNIVPKYPLRSFVESQMLAVIFTSILVGIALTQMPREKALLLISILEAVNLVTDFIIRTAMKLAPYAVFCLLFSTTALFGYQLLMALAAFVLTVLVGLAVHQLVVLPMLVYVLGGMTPLVFFRKIRVTMITAFSTSSSSATLPTAIKCAEEELNVPKPIANFVLPLSASMNHNGTALFEGVTVMFLAQLFGVDLSLQQQLLVLLLCILTATGMAGVPGGSLPLIGIILAQFGVPAGAIAIVLGVDRFLDMCRTMVNITADMTTVVFVARSERRALSRLGLVDSPNGPATPDSEPVTSGGSAGPG